MEPETMTARLDLELTQRLAASFPTGADWQTIQARAFVQDRGDKMFSDWSSTASLEGVGGVYAVLLPVKWFDLPLTLPLHGSHRHRGNRILFQFTLPVLADGYGVVYVGRTGNLRQRWRGHLSKGDRNDGGQVKFGMLDCALHTDALTALRELREHGRIIYTTLTGPGNCANRDVLEMALCARFGPPFNIKSER
jgi:hypothetical protein